MKPESILSLDIEENKLYLDLKINEPTFYHFTDEYDLDILDKISKETNIPVDKIIVKGLFQELQELGVIISYESEQKICEEVNGYCKALC